jgi:hypothetical protein
VKLLTPISGVTIVSGQDILELQPEHVTQEEVGQKAFGLASIPAQWGLPFVSISSDLYKSYVENQSLAARKKLLTDWTPAIQRAARHAGIEKSALIRSSGCGEGMMKRGKYHSTPGKIAMLSDALLEW